MTYYMQITCFYQPYDIPNIQILEIYLYLFFSIFFFVHMYVHSNFFLEIASNCEDHRFLLFGLYLIRIILIQFRKRLQVWIEHISNLEYCEKEEQFPFPTSEVSAIKAIELNIWTEEIRHTFPASIIIIKP